MTFSVWVPNRILKTTILCELMTNCPVTGVTNYGFNIPAFIKGGELQTVMCIFQASSITVPEVLTSQA